MILGVLHSHLQKSILVFVRQLASETQQKIFEDSVIDAEEDGKVGLLRCRRDRLYGYSFGSSQTTANSQFFFGDWEPFSAGDKHVVAIE